MQEISVIGRLGKNAQVHETKNGRKFVAFTMAVNSKRGTETKTTWYEVISFNEQHVTKLVQYLTKGSMIVAIGELDAEAQLGKDGKAYIRLSIIADRLDFVSTGSGDGVSGSTVSVAERYADTDDAVPTPTPQQKVVVPQPVMTASAQTATPVEEDDDLPF